MRVPGRILATVMAVIVVSACGGGGGSTAPATTTTTISGSAVKGPVSGATVTVKKASDGSVLTTTTTGAGGTYSVSVDYAGDVVVEVSGGTYTDEATQLTTALAAPLKSVLAANGGSVTGIVTPLTTMAYTNAFPTAGSTVSSSTFRTFAKNLATQFHLSEEDLVTTPVVTGETNAYGKVLAGLSKYMQFENVNLSSLVNSAFTSAQWTAFSGTFSNAYKAANPGTNITYTFSSDGLTVGGTGVGGGTGTCGINLAGTVTSNGTTVPINQNYCLSGIPEGSCTAGNSAISQALNNQPGVTGNLTTTYTATCAANALAINLL